MEQLGRGGSQGAEGYNVGWAGLSWMELAYGGVEGSLRCVYGVGGGVMDGVGKLGNYGDWRRIRP